MESPSPILNYFVKFNENNIKKKFSTIRKEKNKEHPDGSLRLTMAPAPETQRSFENISMRLAPFTTKKTITRVSSLRIINEFSF